MRQGLARSSFSTTTQSPTLESAGPSLPRLTRFQHRKHHHFVRGNLVELVPCHEVASPQDAESLCLFYENKPSVQRHWGELHCRLSQSLTVDSHRLTPAWHGEPWAHGLRAQPKASGRLLFPGRYSFQGTPGTSSPHAVCPAPSPVMSLSHCWNGADSVVTMSLAPVCSYHLC